jgi:uncharacterized 2Fe-2S/4Fe-4S cluster protein (DUF4445 family)
MKKLTVTFHPLEKSIEIDVGGSIYAAAEKAGIYVNSLCGGMGVCGRCAIKIKSGKVRSVSDFAGDADHETHFLACQTIPESNVEVELVTADLLEETPGGVICRESLKPVALGFVSEKSCLEEGREPVDVPSDGPGSLWSAHLMEISTPTAEDNKSDLERVSKALCGKAPLKTDLSVLQGLPSLLRSSDWKVTAFLLEQEGFTELLSLEEGDRRGDFYGVAVDVGTTTLAASLIDLHRHTILDTMTCYNPQMLFGEDVISRIIHGSTGEGLRKEQMAVIKGINRLIEDMASSTKIDHSRIIALVASGNTTMMHLLLGIDPAYIRREPYVPGASFYPFIPAPALHLAMSARGYCVCLPSVSSYVGGDIVAGVLSCGLADSNELSILMDIGTNGEAVLGCSEWAVCCSCSAGPAFEGGGISHGMRAARGAIHKIRLDPGRNRVEYETLGNVPPRGICGTGLIDLLGQMMRARVIDRAGRLDMSLFPSRVAQEHGVRKFIVAAAEETSHGREICLTQDDIATIIRSKGALYAGVEFLLKKMEISWKDIKKFYISGGFGCSLSIENSIFIGLLPDIPDDRFLYLGNSSLNGARAALLSADAYHRSIEIACSMTSFELSMEPAFMNDYSSALFLPHTDSARFPRVSKELGFSL